MKTLIGIGFTNAQNTFASLVGISETHTSALREMMGKAPYNYARNTFRHISWFRIGTHSIDWYAAIAWLWLGKKAAKTVWSQ